MKCPSCGELTVIDRIEILDENEYYAKARVTRIAPPPYCPMCGYSWWQEELGKEAERITEGL